jgi:hypothetical protein
MTPKFGSALFAAATAAAALGLATQAWALPNDQTTAKPHGPVEPPPVTQPTRPPGQTTSTLQQLGNTAIPIAPNIYTFTVKSFRITDTRSLHEDTDYVSAAVSVNGKQPIKGTPVAMGDLNNGDYPVNLTIPNVVVGPNDTVAFTYAIVNSGYEKSRLESDLTDAVGIVAMGAGAIGGAILGAPAAPVGGDIAGAAVGMSSGAWFTKKVMGVIFADCDGTVAAADYAWTGSALAKRAVGMTMTTEDNNKGTDTPDGCGRNSQYYVTWSVTGKPRNPQAQAQ